MPGKTTLEFGTMANNFSRKPGSSILEVIIAFVVFVLSMAVVIRLIVKARERREYDQRNAILGNLRILEGAKDQWALEHKKNTDTPVTNLTVLSEYFKGGTLHSIVGEAYSPNAIGRAASAQIGRASCRERVYVLV